MDSSELEDDMDIICYGLSSKYSKVGLSNLGYIIFKGNGVTKDEPKGANLILKGLEGFLDGSIKKLLDEFYDKS